MLNGMYSSYINDDNAANAYFLKAITAGKNSDEQSDLSYTHLEYSKFLTKIKNYKEAYKHLVRFNEITAELEPLGWFGRIYHMTQMLQT